MSQNYSFLSYKKGNSFLHKCPALLKILLVPAFSICILFLPPYFSIGLVILQFVLACCLKFSLKEQYCDLRPVILYFFMLLFIQLFSLLAQSLNGEFTISSIYKNFLQVFTWENQKATVFSLLKLFAIMQTSSLVFKTSTSLEMRDAFAKIFGRKSAITNALSMFMNFLPMVAKIWEQSKKAWFARGGKKNIKMYKTLLPVLFSVGLKKAWNTSRALYIRM